MNTPQLQYFYFDGCPFCQMVDKTIKDLKVDVEYKNIHEDQSNLEQLVQDTGRRTVPCLYVDGAPMHESAEIINWLKSNSDDLPKVS